MNIHDDLKNNDDVTLIRNVAIIAHVDHGKTSLTDSLLAEASIISKSQAGLVRYMDSRKDEQDRQITINASAISVTVRPKKIETFKQNYKITSKERIRDAAVYPYLEDDKVGKLHKLNVIDCPGHVDFTAEVEASLSLSDGVLIIVDVVEGVRPQTEAVIKRAWDSGQSILIFINKLDRLLSKETVTNPTEAYYQVQNVITNVLRVLHSHIIKNIMEKESYLQSSEFEQIIPDDIDVSRIPRLSRCSIMLGSAVHGWGATLYDFAKLLYEKIVNSGVFPFDGDVTDLVERLWGDWYMGKKGILPIVPGSKADPLGIRYVIQPLWEFYETEVWTTLNPEPAIQLCKKYGMSPEGLSFDQLYGVDWSLSKFTPAQVILRRVFPLAQCLGTVICNRLPYPLAALEQDQTSGDDKKKIKSNGSGRIYEDMPFYGHSPRAIACDLGTGRLVLDELYDDNAVVMSYINVIQVKSGILRKNMSIYVHKKVGKFIESISVKVDKIFRIMGSFITEITTDVLPGDVVGLLFHDIANESEVKSFMDTIKLDKLDNYDLDSPVTGKATSFLPSSKEEELAEKEMSENESNDTSFQRKDSFSNLETRMKSFSSYINDRTVKQFVDNALESQGTDWLNLRDLTLSSHDYGTMKSLCGDFFKVLSPNLSSSYSVMNVTVRNLEMSRNNDFYCSLLRLLRSDLSVNVTFHSGKWYLSTTGPLHLEKISEELRNVFGRMEYQISEPIISNCETLIPARYVAEKWKLENKKISKFKTEKDLIAELLELEFNMSMSSNVNDDYLHEADNVVTKKTSHASLLMSHFAFPPWNNQGLFGILNEDLLNRSDVVQNGDKSLLPSILKSFKRTYGDKSYRYGCTKDLEWIISLCHIDDLLPPHELKKSGKYKVLCHFENKTNGLDVYVCTRVQLEETMWNFNSLPSTSSERIKKCYADISTVSQVVLEETSHLLRSFSEQGPVCKSPLKNVVIMIDFVNLMTEQLTSSSSDDFEEEEDEYNKNVNYSSNYSKVSLKDQRKINYMKYINWGGIRKQMGLCLESAFFQPGRIRLYEMTRHWELDCDQIAVGKVHRLLTQKRAIILSEDIPDGSSSDYKLNVILPLIETNDLLTLLRDEARGLAKINFTGEGGWRLLDQDPFPEACLIEEDKEDDGTVNLELLVRGNIARKMMNDTRRRHALNTGEQLIKDAEKQRTLSRTK